MILIILGALFGCAAFFGGIAWLVAQVYAEQERQREAEEQFRRLRSVQAVMDRRAKK